MLDLILVLILYKYQHEKIISTNGITSDETDYISCKRRLNFFSDFNFNWPFNYSDFKIESFKTIQKNILDNLVAFSNSVI